MLRKLLYFGFNKKSIPLLSPHGFGLTPIYAHQKRPFSGYKPWAYIQDFTVAFFFIDRGVFRSLSNICQRGLNYFCVTKFNLK